VVAAFFQLFDGGQVISAGALRGLHDVRVPTVITFIAYWVISLPLGYGLAFHTPLGAAGYGRASPQAWAARRCCSGGASTG
jgi:MATE family multidrug resistance protein